MDFTFNKSLLVSSMQVSLIHIVLKSNFAAEVLGTEKVGKEVVLLIFHLNWFCSLHEKLNIS